VEPGEDAVLREESWMDPTADDIWHRRLGHANRGAMSKLPLPVRRRKPKGVCVTCTRAKTCSRTFPKVSESRASAPLELIHSDLIGRLSPKSLGGANYAMTMIDDHSRFVVVKPLKLKSEAASKFKEFRLKAENLTESKIKKFRTDNGGEYVGAGFSEELKDNGIQHQRTNPYSPQQN
jgi:transposase InsO family protein